MALLWAMMPACGRPQQMIAIVRHQQSSYVLVLPDEASRWEKQAAGLIQSFTQKVTGVSLPIVPARQVHDTAHIISIGQTRFAPANLHSSSLPEDGYHLIARGEQIFLAGGGKRGILNAAYAWIEQVLQCRLYADGVRKIPQLKTLSIPAHLDMQAQPVFAFRQVYDPQAMNAEYMDWHRLNDFADFWGLWGHSFFKLVPPETYFAAHPEYFALVNGHRTPTQLCLSNPAVLQLVVNALQQRMRQSPDAPYWSVAPEDNNSFCTCTACEKLYATYGGISGALLHFVNQVAAHFPDHIITTLAYGATLDPPHHIRAAPNVGIMVSTISCDRSAPIATNPRCTTFRQAFEAWARLTAHLMVWDYTVQFTHYLSPFPDFHTFRPNLQYFARYHAEAVFEQGSGEDPSVFDEMRCYLLAQLLWQPDADLISIQQDFLQGYYGDAAPFVAQYLESLQHALLQSHRPLDVYGNPLDARTSWLSTDSLLHYQAYLQKALQAVVHQPAYTFRVEKLYLSWLYLRLMQAWFYGTEPYGVFQKQPDGKWRADSTIIAYLEKFQTLCEQQHIRYLNEDHQTVSDFITQFQQMISQGVKTSLAFQKPVRLLTPYIPDYPAKGPQTLTDGMLGTNDYAFNWLGWYGQNMEVEIDLQHPDTLHLATIGFLSDARHQIFPPQSIQVFASVDGKNFPQVAQYASPTPKSPDEGAHRTEITLALPHVVARYVRIKAIPLQTMPGSNHGPDKLPAIFADEIEIQ